MQSDSGTGSLSPEEEGIQLPWKPRSRQEQGRQTEGKVIKMGLRAHPNSGAGPIKWDASDADNLVEIKDANKSYTISADYIDSLYRDAVRQGKTPVLIIKFANDIVIEAVVWKERS